MAQVFELKSDGFLYHKETRILCLTGPAAKNETVVLFRATLNTEQSREKSRREFESFKEAARKWDQRTRLGFFVVDLHANPKLVATSQNSHTNLSVASSICIFYSNGKPQVLLKKISDDRDVLAFCTQGFEKVYSARPPAHQQQMYSQPQQSSNAKYYTPEGLNQPSTASLRTIKPMNNDHEHNLLTPENVIPYNTPWKNENE